jgi:hypothetical protein
MISVSLFQTKCKEDYLMFVKDNFYICMLIDNDCYCVLNGGKNFDNLAFTNTEFIQYFYTEKKMKILKLEKLNNI